MRTFAEFVDRCIDQGIDSPKRCDFSIIANMGRTALTREAVAQVARLLEQGGEIVVGRVGWFVSPDPASAAHLASKGLGGDAPHAFPWNQVYWALVSLGVQGAADLCWGRAREYEKGVAEWARAPFALPVIAPTGPNDYIASLARYVAGCAGSKMPFFSWTDAPLHALEAYLVAQDAIAQYPWVREVVERELYCAHGRTAHRSPWALDGAFVLPHGEWDWDWGAVVLTSHGWRVYDDEGGEGVEPESNAELVDLIKAGLHRLNARRKACEGVSVSVSHVSSAQLEEAYAWAARYNASVGYLHLHFSEEPRAHAALELPALYPTMLGD
jgi:hypothetical protein